MRCEVIFLRNFTIDDADVYQKIYGGDMALYEIKAMFLNWKTKEYAGKYFEMFAVIKDEEIVGSISLYQHSESVISCGPTIFEPYRRQGIGKDAMLLAMDIAKSKGYKAVLQQVRIDNMASIELHNKLAFETNRYIYKNKKGNEVLIYIKLL